MQNRGIYKLFSVDDHIIEPPDVWTRRVPARLRDLAPHIVGKDGKQVWSYDGDRIFATLGLNAVAGKPRELWNWDMTRYSDMIAGCYDPKVRARDFLSNNILATVSFGTFPGFGGERMLSFRNREAAAVSVRAWNDYILEEWCPAGPRGLYVPMILPLLWDPAASAAEIRRCAALGARALCFPENPGRVRDAEGRYLPSHQTGHWDPLWDACQETGMAVCMHISTSDPMLLVPSDDAPPTTTIALGAVASWVALVNIVMSPVCRKFPALKLVFSEGGFGWLPAALERADRQFERHRAWSGLDEILPSEIFRRNCFMCMIEEPQALSYRHLVGVDRILWECDYPHADTPWPHSQAAVAGMFDALPREEAEAITYRNAERVFDWKVADPPGPDSTAHAGI